MTTNKELQDWLKQFPDDLVLTNKDFDFILNNTFRAKLAAFLSAPRTSENILNLSDFNSLRKEK